MSLFSELKRRNIFRVMVAYIVVAWLLLQVSDVLVPALRLPDWFNSGVAFVLLLGFPVALVLSWAFELTPEGIRRDTGPEHGDGAATGSRRWGDVVLAVALVAIVGFIAWDRWSGPRSAEPVAEAPPAEAGETAELPEPSVADSPRVTPTIAVLPLADMSEEQNQEYMGDGIAEEMLNLLAKIPELRVISRSSAFSFKGSNADIPTIAGRLGATHVLEGSIRKAGDQVRITAQLIEAGSDTHLWSETFDRRMDNIFRIQDEIARAVVAALRIQLVGEAPSAPRVDSDAYELALRARFHWLRRAEGDEQEALRLYREAVAIDPSYGPAWTGLSVALAVAALKERIDRETGLAQADEAAFQGVELNPESPEAHVRVGQALARRGDIRGQVDAYERALALDPNNSLALGVSAIMAWRRIKPERAVELYRRAAAADPMSTVMPGNLAGYLIELDRLDEAEAALGRARSLVQNADDPLVLGREVELAAAREQWQRVLELAARLQDEQTMLFYRTLALHGLGDERASQASLERFLGLEPAPDPAIQAELFSELGLVDRAFAALAEVENLPLYGGYLLLDRSFRNLHADPRWAAIEERVRAHEW